MAGTERPSRNRLLMVAGAVVATFLLGAAIVTTAGYAPGDAKATTADSGEGQPLPVRPTEATGERAGMPVGFDHDDDGAVDAAVAYAAASQRWLYWRFGSHGEVGVMVASRSQFGRPA